MKRKELAIILRLFGNGFSLACLVGLMIPVGEAREPLLPSWILIPGAVLGALMVFVGIMMTYWPKSEAQIRAEVEEQMAQRRSEQPPGH